MLTNADDGEDERQADAVAADRLTDDEDDGPDFVLQTYSGLLPAFCSPNDLCQLLLAYVHVIHETPRSPNHVPESDPQPMCWPFHWLIYRPENMRCRTHTLTCQTAHAGLMPVQGTAMRRR